MANIQYFFCIYTLLQSLCLNGEGKFVNKLKSYTTVRILIAGTKGKRVSGTGATAGTSGDCPTGYSCVGLSDPKKGTEGSCV